MEQPVGIIRGTRVYFRAKRIIAAYLVVDKTPCNIRIGAPNETKLTILFGFKTTVVK